jgi:hypothetical protein
MHSEITWELIATWIGMALTIGGGLITVGKQTQKIENQQIQIDELKQEARASKDFPVKLATLETDMKYLIKELSEVKTLLLAKIAGE